jgi:hypothetical protein
MSVTAERVGFMFVVRAIHGFDEAFKQLEQRESSRL